MTRHEIQQRATERRALAERLRDASYGDRDAKQRYLRLAAAADIAATAVGFDRHVAKSAADAEALTERQRALLADARRYRRCARDSSTACFRNLERRREVLGRKPRGSRRPKPTA